jgi:hypothetical protein
MGIRVLFPQMIGDDNAAIAHEIEAATDDAGPLHFFTIELSEFLHRRLEGLLARGSLRRGEQERGGKKVRHGGRPVLIDDD